MTTDIHDADVAHLSAAARSVWAKSWPNPCIDGEIERWLPLHRHLLDTAGIATRLWDHWLAPHVKELLAKAVGSPESARTLAVWLAGAHDVGKASPAFAVQVRPLAKHMTAQGLRMDASLADTEERRKARHELVGYLAVRAWLVERWGFDSRQAKKIASVIAAHHGRPPSEAAVADADGQTRLVGDGLWADVREDLLDTITASVTAPEDIASWERSPLPRHALVLLSAFVIVTDWVASNDHLFPLAELRQSDVETHGRVERAWTEIDLPAPWKARSPDDDDELFDHRFELPSPRPMQSAVMELARTCETPSLFIVEENMGAGKTEAALAAAEILASRFGLSGVFIGLPTRATADGMFSRAMTWADHLGLETPLNVFLAHAKASLNSDFDKRQQDARFRSIGDRHTTRRSRDTWGELVVAHNWFSSPKRGPLADLVIGTIDQALVGALRSKHVMLRHLALAGKVVIFDEIHSFDAFTDTYIERILNWLGSYGVPVIMLSATLPSEKRKAFIAAYEQGRVADAPPRRGTRGAAGRRAVATADPLAMLDGNIGYPVITASSPTGPPRIVTPSPSSKPKEVAVERVPDDLSVLADTLFTALEGGGTAVVIRNTVTRVQETAAFLRAQRDDIPVVVTHSRFLARDRARKDRELLDLFGKEGERPDRMIVVASQVVEQSLDIDFDLMVTDVAPVDLILQRAGRLHRHGFRTRPERLREPRLVLAGVDWEETPPAPVRGSIAVYGQHILLRTLAALEGRERIALPDDIPVLVQKVYGPDEIHPLSWNEKAQSARAEFGALQEDKRRRAETFQLAADGAEGSLIGWIDASAGDAASDSEAQAAVRDGEETLEVLVIQQKDGVWVTPDWLDGEDGNIQLPDNEPPDGRLTRIVLGCALRLPAAMCHPGRIDAQIADLESQYPIQAWHGSHALRGELVLPLDADRSGRLGDDIVRYDPENGFSYSRTPASIPAESEARW
ncbi:CRISPR-associated helicase Cas3' [Microbacterium halotolerans]|uniref:CRISPR-associated helicase Cas3' n=1 Tax=Microbacterium halotolerans TaxID=246613 RepID=UPI0013C3327A|nr:CRISPR-associated helicase Cas3' [Microbacterium halotolerans]